MSLPRTIALIGANGMLARKVIENAPTQDRLVRLDLPEFDLTDRAAVLQQLQEISPDVIINCAAYTKVDQCEAEEALAARVNGDGPGYLAEAAVACGAILVQISTDYVFSGNKQGAYVETDPTGPLSAYGRTKLLGEQAIIDSGLQRFIIIRTSWLYGPGGPNFVETMLRLAAERDELAVVADQVGSPTYTGDLARAIFALVNRCASGEGTVCGLYHFSNSGSCSWHGFAEEIVARGSGLGLPVRVQRVKAITSAEFPQAAVRPRNSLLDKSKYLAVVGGTIPAWQESLQIYLQERESQH